MNVTMIRGQRLTEPRTPITLPARPAWMHHPRRPCRDEPALWTSDVADVRKEAAKLCRELDCPVLQECGRWAIETGERHYVWGGLDFSAGGEPEEVDNDIAGPQPEGAGAERAGAGRKPDTAIEAQVRELVGQGLSDTAIALRLDKWPGAIGRVRQRLGIQAQYGPGGRAKAGVA